MTDIEIQPWGTAPTPLLPASIVAEFGHMSAPRFIIEAIGSHATLADLGGPLWEHLDAVSNKSLKEITALFRPLVPALFHLPIRSGELLSRPVHNLPFCDRTRNCILRDPDRFTAKRLTFGDILSARNFGVRSAIEFACLVEAAMESVSNVDASETAKNSASPGVSSTPQKITSAFQALGAYAAAELKVDTLADVLPGPADSWPPEIKHLWESMGQINTKDVAGDLFERYAVPQLLSKALAPIDGRLREILTERVLVTEHAVTQTMLGQRMGVGRGQVKQLEDKAISLLNRLRNGEFRPVFRHAQLLRSKLGVGFPAADATVGETLDVAVADIVENSDTSPEMSEAVLLWLAGPYKNSQGWLVAESNLQERSLQALLEQRDHRGVVSNKAVGAALTQLGFIQSVHNQWLEFLGDLKRVDGGHVYLKGTIAEKVGTLLRAYDRPVAIEEIMEVVGSVTIQSVKTLLNKDPEFWRINKQSEYVLANTPGYAEYTRITDQIIREIEACGGAAQHDQLVESVVRAYGVKKISVAAFLRTPMFTKDEHGVVRVRDPDAVINVNVDITKKAGCYRDVDGRWMWRVLVNQAVVRGHGRLVPTAFAQEAGCSIGNKLEIETTEGPLAFNWQLASTTGATIGSLRPAVMACEAVLGDYLFVCAAEPIITFKRLSKDRLESAKSSLQRLALMLGAEATADEAGAERQICNALGINPEEGGSSRMQIRRTLNSRGETELAELVPPPD